MSINCSSPDPHSWLPIDLLVALCIESKCDAKGEMLFSDPMCLGRKREKPYRFVVLWIWGDVDLLIRWFCDTGFGEHSLGRRYVFSSIFSQYFYPEKPTSAYSRNWFQVISSPAIPASISSPHSSLAIPSGTPHVWVFCSSSGFRGKMPALLPP